MKESLHLYKKIDALSYLIQFSLHVKTSCKDNFVTYIGYSKLKRT